jgi:hypothetical protein
MAHAKSVHLPSLMVSSAVGITTWLGTSYNGVLSDGPPTEAAHTCTHIQHD